MAAIKARPMLGLIGFALAVTGSVTYLVKASRPTGLPHSFFGSWSFRAQMVGPLGAGVGHGSQITRFPLTLVHRSWTGNLAGGGLFLGGAIVVLAIAAAGILRLGRSHALPFALGGASVAWGLSLGWFVLGLKLTSLGASGRATEGCFAFVLLGALLAVAGRPTARNDVDGAPRWTYSLAVGGASLFVVGMFLPNDSLAGSVPMFFDVWRNWVEGHLVVASITTGATWVFVLALLGVRPEPRAWVRPAFLGAGTAWLLPWIIWMLFDQNRSGSVGFWAMFSGAVLVLASAILVSVGPAWSPGAATSTIELSPN